MDRLKQIKLKLKFLFGSLFYASYAPKAFLYTRKRDNIEREFIKQSTEPGFDKPGKLLRAEATARGANFYFEMAELEVCFLTED
ncbi:alpha-glucosidase [Nostoc carneum NIES-2107]|nr:alpha-glucosidase [Nostoc carneum NIES-2107]